MFKLRRQFWSVSRAASPSRDFRNALSRTLCQEFDATYPARDKRLHWKLATIPVVVVVVVFLAGTGVYAYDSPVVSQGHPLFVMKRGMEEVRRVIILNDDSRQQFELMLAHRRMAEMQKRAEQIPQELRLQIQLVHDSIDKMDLSDAQKQELFHEEVEELLLQSVRR